jgi:hypothetical protein
MTIVMNTKTGAVTEYDNFDFQSLTPTHAGSAAGLFRLGGDDDLGEPIVASITTGKTLWGATKKKFLDFIHFAMTGSGISGASVVTPSTTYEYEFQVRPAGVSRAKPGRGIRENYLAFGYSNLDGADFQIDRIEAAEQPSKNRKV